MIENRLARRKVLQWFAAFAAVDANGGPVLGRAVVPGVVNGYGTDPSLATFNQRGDYWSLTMTQQQRAVTEALADIILPADDHGPAASAVGVVDFVDEWISAPYPRQEQDREVIIPGIAWIDSEAEKRFGALFSDLVDPLQKQAICDDLCDSAAQSKGQRQAVQFFHRFTTICTGAYYSTPEGWQAVGYVGNMPSGAFAGPPVEVLDLLNLTQTVLE